MGKLTDRKAQTVGPGMYGDGQGLWLQVRTEGTRAWVFRYMIAGQARAMGLGPLHTISLAEAREMALDCRKQVLRGLDPIDERRRERTAVLGQLTFKECAEQYLDAHGASWRSDKHRKNWASTIKRFAYPYLGDLPVNTIGTNEVMRVLDPIWREKTVTAKRVRQRIERVLNWAKTREYREGDNPARWRGHLDNLLAKPSEIAPVTHHPALPFAEAPEFMAALRERTEVPAKALEFTILTAARSGEVRGLKWEEIDGATWTVPAERMKANGEHRVPLSKRVQTIIKEMRKHGETGFVFGSQVKAGKSFNELTLLRVLDNMGRSDLTVHGFRSTFRDWISERTAFSSDVAEKALAHKVGDETRRSYERGDLFDKRRKLMDAWANYCESDPGALADVVPIRKGA